MDDNSKPTGAASGLFKDRPQSPQGVRMKHLNERIEHIRAICEIKDIQYSQETKGFTAFSIDRALLRELLAACDQLREKCGRLELEVAGLKVMKTHTPVMHKLRVAELEEQLTKLRARNEKLTAALRGIIEIGKRDMSNLKYDGYFEEAREALAGEEQ